jgi:hypothetical protein
MVIVPLQQAPVQTLNISLDGQACVLNIYAAGPPLQNETTPPIYVDLYIGTTQIMGGMFGLIGVRLVRDSYLGLLGDFVFNDTQPDPNLGPENPEWEGLGVRWQLLYLYPGELDGDC